MLVHINESKEAKEFFKAHGLKIDRRKSAHNCIYLVDTITHKHIELWAESDMGIAAGIPGVYIDEVKG